MLRQAFLLNPRSQRPNNRCSWLQLGGMDATCTWPGTGQSAEHPLVPTRGDLGFFWFLTLPWQFTPAFGGGVNCNQA